LEEVGSVVGPSKQELPKIQTSDKNKETLRHLEDVDLDDWKRHYICRVTRDFEICEQDAKQLWDKFMGTLLLKNCTLEYVQHESHDVEVQETQQLHCVEILPQHVEDQTLVENQNTEQTGFRVEELQPQKDIQVEDLEALKELLETPDTEMRVLVESPISIRMRQNSQGKITPLKLDLLPYGCISEQDVAAQIVENLIRVLLRSNQCRLITLQMTTLLVKELVHSLDSGPYLIPLHYKLIEEAYADTTQNLRACLSGSLGDIFLELFEHELKTFKQINFDGLMADISSLLLPVSATPMSGIALSKRLPSGEAEKIQKSVQAFLVLRELKYAVLKTKDDRLPFREDPVPSLKPKDVYAFPIEDLKSVVPFMMPVGPTKKRLQRYLVIESSVVLIVEPDPRSIAKNVKITPQTLQQTTSTLPISGHVCNTIPLQNIEMELDKIDDTYLHLTSHPTTSRFVLGFDSSTECQSAQHRLEKARNKVRANKMRQIDEMLKDDGVGVT